MTRPPSPRRLAPPLFMELARGFQTSRIILTGFELGIFTALGDRRRPGADVARAVKAHPRATERLMNALCVLGLLTKRGGRFANTDFARRHLVAGREGYLVGVGHALRLWDVWHTLTRAVRRGRSVAEVRGAPDVRAFIGAMHERARRHGPLLAAQLNLTGVRRILDVGGGSGAYAMACVRAARDARATVFDLPRVIPLTRRYIAAAGLADRVRGVCGDYRRDPFGAGYDLILLSHVLHSHAPAENRRLLRKCARALAPGGRVVVQDFIVDASRTQPPFAALFALNMLVATPAGDTYTEPEIRRWMRAAGLRRIVRRNTPFDSALLIGRLPRRLLRTRHAR